MICSIPYVAGVILGIAVVGVGVYLSVRKPPKTPPPPTETIDTSVCLDDVVQYFRSLGLDQNTQKPFIATAQCKELAKVYDMDKPGYDALLIGVTDSGGKLLTGSKILYCKGLNKDITDIIPSSGMVVLS